MKHFHAPLALLTCLLAAPAFAETPGEPAVAGARFTSDAYPGFDSDRELTKPEKKEPRWFSWINGPKMSDAAAQFAWAGELEAKGSLSSARKAYDALVREWPAAREAAAAQQKVAELELAGLDLEAAFDEYRYLLDFYSSGCDYASVASEMYRLAEMMRDEGKTVMFFHFANSADVRRAYESIVIRAPGADFVPRAMLAIAALREDEGDDENAIRVYENLRNIHPGTAEAAEALVRELRVRMRLLERHGYNKARVKDTIAFLELARRGEISTEAAAEIDAALAKALEIRGEEAWNAAKFYDSRTRTRRSAVTAYEKFIAEYPESIHAEEARIRIEALKEEGK